MKIGIFGGTFNPPHRGHERLIAHITEELSLDKALIIPNKAPTHKRVDELADNEDRYNMCRLAFKSPKYEISKIEIDRDTDSYMIFTVDELREKYPDDELYLIIGSDMLLMFHKWYKYREIMEKCKICVASRESAEGINVLRKYAFERLGVYIRELRGKNIIISPLPPFELSSGEIREKIKNGEDISALAEPEVLEYIERRGLYGYRKK